MGSISYYLFNRSSLSKCLFRLLLLLLLLLLSSSSSSSSLLGSSSSVTISEGLDKSDQITILRHFDPVLDVWVILHTSYYQIVKKFKTQYKALILTMYVQYMMNMIIKLDFERGLLSKILLLSQGSSFTL